MLTIHHLGKSQSERIIWLCEELGFPYELKIYDRDPVTRLAPPEYQALHPLGTAPIITDGSVVMAESAAIMEYIMAKHDGESLAVPPSAPAYPDYVYWFHFANGTLQPAMGRSMSLGRLNLAADNPTLAWVNNRRDHILNLVEKRLGEADYLAGDTFTAADIVHGVFVDHHAHFPAARSFAVPEYPFVPPADRRASRLPTGDGKRRSRH